MHIDTVPTPSPRPSGERAEARGFDLEKQRLLTPGPLLLWGREGEKPGQCADFVLLDVSGVFHVN
jgi:hypothetical protein